MGLFLIWRSIVMASREEPLSDFIYLFPALKENLPPYLCSRGELGNIKSHSGVKLKYIYMKYQLHSAFFPRFCHLYYFLFVAVRQIHFYLMLCNPELKATALYVSYRPISELKGDSWEDCFNLRVRLWVPVCVPECKMPLSHWLKMFL